MKTIKLIGLLWLALFGQHVDAQIRYKVTQNSTTGAQIVRKENPPGSGIFNLPVATLPSDATYGRFGGKTDLIYVTEPKGQNNITQFGTGKYFSPNFMLAASYFGNLTPNTRRSAGISGYTTWDVKPTDLNQVQAGEMFAYTTENILDGAGLHGGHVFHMTELSDFGNRMQAVIPRIGKGDYAKYNALIFDIEVSTYLVPGNSQSGPLPGFQYAGYYDANGGGNGNWDVRKLQTIVCEFDGVTRTLEQLAAMGPVQWDAEMHQRRANRMILILEISKILCAPGTWISAGWSAYQGVPRTDFANNNNIWVDGDGNVSHVTGGNSQGIFTMNVDGQSRQINMSGNIQYHENRMWGYWYRNTLEFEQQDLQDIFVTHKAGTQTYPYLWSKQKTEHTVAIEKGYLQLNRRLMQVRSNKQYPIVRMMQAFYESAYIPGLNYQPNCPFPEVQNVDLYGNPNFLLTPRLALPPYILYSSYCVSRFFAGNEPGWGFMIFPEEPTVVTKDYSTIPYFNFTLHNMTQLMKARNDMQPYEKFFVGSTLVENPEVQINGTGEFTSYDGTQANNQGQSFGPQKPAYMLRYNLAPGGYRVLILGGMNQGFTTERTDIVRAAPGGILAGSRFKIKLRGPGAHVYEFFVKVGDINQLFEATPVISSVFDMPAYSGRTTNDASTVPVTPTNPTTPTTPVTPAPTPENPTPVNPTPTPTTTAGLYPDGFPYQPFASTPISADNYWPTYETGRLKAIVGMEQQIGLPSPGKGTSGDVVKLYDKLLDPGVTWPAYAFTENDVYGGQLVNDADYSIPFGKFRLKGGYGIGACLYLNPKPYYGFSEIGYPRPGPGYSGLGYNPLGQDDLGMSSKVLDYGRQGNSYYLKTLPVLYSDILAYAYPCTFEYWHYFQDNVWTTYFKFTNNRTGASGPGGLDKAYHPLMDYISDAPQELPCVYTNAYGGRNKITWYDGNSPGTYDSNLRNVNVGYNYGFRTNGHNATENWCAIVADNGAALGLITIEPHFAIGYFGSGNLDADKLKPNMLTTYMENRLKCQFDNQGTYYFRYRIVVGTIAEIRAEAYKEANRPKTSIQYKFNVPSRLGWSYGTYGDGATLGAPMEKRVWDNGVYSIGTDGVWNLKIGRSPYSVLVSPGIAIKASDNQHIYFRYKYNGERTTWDMTFIRNKQREGSAATAAWEQQEEGYRFDSQMNDQTQRQTFSVINDNQWHIADINLSGNSEWNNSSQQYIQRFTIRPNSAGVANGTADLAIDWISSNSTGPSN